MENLIYKIGEYYQYPSDSKKTKFKLIEKRNYVFLFECGHWCTDSVFADLIRCKTGVQVYKEDSVQLEFDF